MDGFQEKKWFVYIRDHHEGPFSLEDIEGKMRQGQVSSQNYVWADGMSDWKPMPSVSAFESLISNKNTSIVAPVVTMTPEVPAPSEPEIQPVLQVVAPAPVAVEATAAPMSVEVEKKIEEPQKSVAGPVKQNRRWSRVIRIFLILMIPAFIGAAYFTGRLDSLLSGPALQAGLKTVSDLTRPVVTKVIEKIPALSQWISPLPSLMDVSPEEYQDLKSAASASLSSEGPRVSTALSKSDPLAPFFYLATNALEGTAFQVVVEGVPETLLNQLDFSASLQAKIEKKLGKTGALRFPDGRPLPRGDYWVYVYESDQQTAEVQTFLAALQPSSEILPNHLPKGMKIISKKTYFLGGLKDAVYEERLKEFHEKLALKAKAELDEIRQFTQTLDSQMEATLSEFTRLRQGKIATAQIKAWKSFHEKWLKLNTQLSESFMKWTPQAIENEYFYGKLYKLTQEFGQVLGRLHELQDSFFMTRVDLKSFEIQFGESSAQAVSALAELRSKIEHAEKLGLTPNGMPRREGL